MARRKALKERIEPRFSDEDDDAPELVAERRAGPRRERRGADEKPSRRREPRRRRRSLFGRLFYWGFVLAIWGLIGGGGVFLYYGSQLPHIEHLAIPKRPPNIAVLGRDGTLLANRGDTGGAAIRLSELPPFLPKAFIAIEDRRFYSHWGVDPVGVLRALVNNLAGRGVMQGGSTLTQQLAKNLFLSPERSYLRKGQELVITGMLELLLDKRRILEMYLNSVEWGDGVYGAQAASQQYFHVPAARLSPLQAARLAVMLPAPHFFQHHLYGPYIDRRSYTIAARARDAQVPR